MIVDCHTRIWPSPDLLGVAAGDWLERNGGRRALSADCGEHMAASEEVTHSLVWGFRSRRLKADVPNTFIADYVAQHAPKMIGIAAVDPPEPDAMERLANIAKRPEFAGVTVSPAGQGFHPTDTRAMAVYEFCAANDLPVFVEGAADLGASAAMEFARPHLFDEVARTFPRLTIVLAQMGWPWVDEALALLTKQPRVYADIAALLRRPWVAYQSLVRAHQFDVSEKLLFGSDFPFSAPAEAIERIYRLNQITQGSNLPGVPREVLRGIVERDALGEMRIPRP